MVQIRVRSLLDVFDANASFCRILLRLKFIIEPFFNNIDVRIRIVVSSNSCRIPSLYLTASVQCTFPFCVGPFFPLPSSKLVVVS